MPTQADQDKTEILRLDTAWNEAYLQNDRARLANILADDFSALAPSGEAITKASLMINPPPARSASFSEQSVMIFGATAISRGRLQLDLGDRKVDQRFMRVFAKREGTWRAVSAAVTPILA
ncbi:MAG TPA: nuclear transport factor 2 family protein [Alphaproteobacteria bacterium]|nr:nuclear transport factor 2 family protein [Alphaproteobacteria bacterium]